MDRTAVFNYLKTSQQDKLDKNTRAKISFKINEKRKGIPRRRPVVGTAVFYRLGSMGPAIHNAGPLTKGSW